MPLGKAPAPDRSGMGSGRAGATDWLGSALADGKRWWPWGDSPPDAARANLDFAYAGQIDVGACAAGDSAFGCRQMIGNAWEWTASDVVPFKGFAPGSLRGLFAAVVQQPQGAARGSFATSARIARPGYRNFFTPERNEVIASFRTCAL